MKKILFTFCLLICTLTSTFAQRLMPTSRSVAARLGLNYIAHSKFFDSNRLNLSLEMIQYLNEANYLCLNLNLNHNYLIYDKEKLPVQSYLVGFDYMQNILHDKGYNIMSYMGLGYVMGYEEVNNSQRWLKDGAYLLNRSRVIYGIELPFTIESFITDKFVFIFRTDARLTFRSDISKLRLGITMGIRYNL